jgi:hypothetical protein
MRTIIFASLISLIGLLFTVLAAEPKLEATALTKPESTPASRLLQPGVRAPLFSMRAISGELVPLRLYCGDTLAKPSVNPTRNTVVLSFWATYCVP